MVTREVLHSVAYLVHRQTTPERTAWGEDRYHATKEELAKLSHLLSELVLDFLDSEYLEKGEAQPAPKNGVIKYVEECEDQRRARNLLSNYMKPLHTLAGYSWTDENDSDMGTLVLHLIRACQRERV